MAADSPGIAVPPPLLYAAAFAVGVALEAVAPTPGPPVPVAAVVVIVGLIVWGVLDPGAMREFRTAGTEVSPSRPVTALVTSGPYRWTRNPMYLGMAVVQAAFAIAFGVLWALLTLVVVLIVVDRLIVPREELCLLELFGEGYLRYQRDVRRWL